MNPLQQWKQCKLYSDFSGTCVHRDTSSEELIASYLSKSWWNYFGITESFNRLRPLQHWVRRRLRAVIWKHWKNRRTRVGELLKRGVYRNQALTTGCARKGPWRMSKVKWVQIALPDLHFKSLGLVFPWI